MILQELWCMQTFRIITFGASDAKRKNFKRRERGKSIVGHSEIFASHALGRIYTVHPNKAECSYLRFLLITVRSPTSFIHKRIMDGIEQNMFRNACEAFKLKIHPLLCSTLLQIFCLPVKVSRQNQYNCGRNTKTTLTKIFCTKCVQKYKIIALISQKKLAMKRLSSLMIFF